MKAGQARAQMKYSAEWVKRNYMKKKPDIRMRDGILLHTIIYEPKDLGVKHPVLMERTCYTISPNGEDNYQGFLPTLGMWMPAISLSFRAFGGKNMSEGEYDDIRPFIENKKLYRKESKNVGMPDVSHTFLPGHRMMIQIQSRWFPLVDRTPQTFCNIYTCDRSAYVKPEINTHC